MDDADAEVFAIADALEMALLALEKDRAFIAALRIDPAQHLHQRRFARAVLANDGVDFARPTEIETLSSAFTPGMSW